MNIQTKYLGETNISEENIIQFPHGLPGFSDETSFVLMELPDGGTFQVLQSVQTAELAFIVTSPYHFYPNYSINLDDSVVELLKIKQPEDVAIYTIVTVKDPFSASTMNLKAPLVINTKTLLAKQQILNDDRYQTKAPIAAQHSKGGDS